MFAVQVSYLEVEVDTLTEQLGSPEVCEETQNGSVSVDDLDHIQRVNRELEQQVGDKNRVRHVSLLPAFTLQINKRLSPNINQVLCL